MQRQQRRAKATRQQLLDAARTVFAQRGLDSARIEEITESADVGKGTFYYHFKNKERLIRILVQGLLDELNTELDRRCNEKTSLPELLDTLLQTHIDFFNNRWEDFVLYFQSRADLTLEQGYDGIDTPFVAYLERIEDHIDRVVKVHLSKPLLRRIACAVAGFVSGYYSFAAIASPDEDVEQAFRPLRGAMVSSLTRFVTEAIPGDQKMPG